MNGDNTRLASSGGKADSSPFRGKHKTTRFAGGFFFLRHFYQMPFLDFREIPAGDVCLSKNVPLFGRRYFQNLVNQNN
jgi:hypothetical protein